MRSHSWASPLCSSRNRERIDNLESRLKKLHITNLAEFRKIRGVVILTS